MYPYLEFHEYSLTTLEPSRCIMARHEPSRFIPRGTLAVHGTYGHVTTHVLFMKTTYVIGHKKCTQTSTVSTRYATLCATLQWASAKTDLA